MDGVSQVSSRHRRHGEIPLALPSTVARSRTPPNGAPAPTPAAGAPAVAGGGPIPIAGPASRPAPRPHAAMPAPPVRSLATRRFDPDAALLTSDAGVPHTAIELTARAFVRSAAIRQTARRTAPQRKRRAWRRANREGSREAWPVRQPSSETRMNRRHDHGVRIEQGRSDRPPRRRRHALIGHENTPMLSLAGEAVDDHRSMREKRGSVHCGVMPMSA